MIDHVRAPLATLLGLDGARFEYGSLLGHPPRLEPDGTVMTRAGRRDAGQFGLPAEEIELRTLATASITAGSC